MPERSSQLVLKRDYEIRQKKISLIVLSVSHYLNVQRSSPNL